MLCKKKLYICPQEVATKLPTSKTEKMKRQLLISSDSKENLILALNKYYYSTTYDINEKGEVVWKNGELRKGLIYVKERGRHKIKM